MSDEQKRKNDIQRLKEKKSGYGFEDFRLIMEILRSPEGCPWDKVQTHKSIRNDLIEETYEVIEAIDKNDTVLMREELGDVMMQVMFHARIEEESNGFSMDDVINDVCVKLIHRHPHVFQDTSVDTAEEVIVNWEKIKNDEKARKTVADSMNSIPPMLPALMRAQKAGKKAAKVGFDFPDAEAAMQKIAEETNEIRQAKGTDEVFSEIGDLLFASVNVGRLLGVNCEEALNASTDKFIRRFAEMERLAALDGKNPDSLSFSEFDFYYEKAKKGIKV